MWLQSKALIAFGGLLQVDRLPLSLNHGRPDLRWRLLQLRLLVGEENLFHTDSAFGAVRQLEAGVQALMSHALAIAVTRHLVEDVGNLRRQFVGLGLIRILEGLAPLLVFGENLRLTRFPLLKAGT
jgi:hypothetical protein